MQVINGGSAGSYEFELSLIGRLPGNGRLQLSLSDGSESPLEPGSLQVGAGEALYTAVKSGKFQARFTPAAQIALSPWLVAAENGEILLEIAGRRHTLGNSSEGS